MLRRATFTLAITQLVSWGVLFYGFAVVAPELVTETGWSETAVSGAFSLGLLVSGVAAPPVARALTSRDPRLVLTAGSLLGAAGMVLFAAAHTLPLLYVAWVVVGAAMAATLYEPAVVVLVAIDPTRRLRTITVLTVVGGLASTAFAPLTGNLADELGWRTAIVILALGGGAVTALLHAVALPAPTEPLNPSPGQAHPGARMWSRLHRYRAAVLFEQAAIVATTVHLVGVLTDRGASIGVAALVLGAVGVGKVPGRLLLLGPTGRVALPVVAATCSAIQLVGFALPLVTTEAAVLLPGALVVGAAAGTTTVVRPLLLIDLVGTPPFASVSARLQRAIVFARAGSPLALGATVSLLGWTAGWAMSVAAFGVAAERYLSLHPRRGRWGGVSGRSSLVCGEGVPSSCAGNPSSQARRDPGTPRGTPHPSTRNKASGYQCSVRPASTTDPDDTTEVTT